jgi:hypothetical protein
MGSPTFFGEQVKLEAIRFGAVSSYTLKHGIRGMLCCRPDAFTL